MTSQTILYLVLGGIAGGFINGFAGTGTALFALGFFLTVLEPARAVAIVALMSALAGLQGLWLVRKAIADNAPRLVRFIVPGLLGIPLGLGLLSYIDADALRLLVAFLLIFYGLYFGFRSALPSFDGRTPKTDICVGFIGGIMSGLASLSGAIPTIWLSMRPWPKAETRAVLQPFNIAILGCTVLILALRGAYDAKALTAIAVTFPVLLLSVQVGIAAFRRVSDDQFRRVLILLCLVMGLGILLRDLAGI